MSKRRKVLCSFKCQIFGYGRTFGLAQRKFKMKQCLYFVVVVFYATLSKNIKSKWKLNHDDMKLFDVFFFFEISAKQRRKSAKRKKKKKCLEYIFYDKYVLNFGTERLSLSSSLSF